MDFPFYQNFKHSFVFDIVETVYHLVIYMQSNKILFVSAGRVQQYAYYHIPKSANTACTKRS